MMSKRCNLRRVLLSDPSTLGAWGPNQNTCVCGLVPGVPTDTRLKNKCGILVALVNDFLGRASLHQTNIRGGTPLFMACQFGHAIIVALLLEASKNGGGPGVNDCMEDGTTPLFFACQEGRLDVVKLLLAQPDITINQTIASPTVEDDLQGWTALHTASEHGQLHHSDSHLDLSRAPYVLLALNILTQYPSTPPPSTACKPTHYKIKMAPKTVCEMCFAIAPQHRRALGVQTKPRLKSSNK